MLQLKFDRSIRNMDNKSIFFILHYNLIIHFHCQTHLYTKRTYREFIIYSHIMPDGMGITYSYHKVSMLISAFIN